MKKKKFFIFSFLVFILLLSACMNTTKTESDADRTDELPTAEESDDDLVLETPEESGNPEQPPGVNNYVKDQCQALADAFNQNMTDTAGWVRGVKDRVYFNNTAGTYDPLVVEEFWYRFDPNGYILEGYIWSGTQDGEIQQEGVWLNGWYDGIYVNDEYNLDYDFDPEGEIQGSHSPADAPMDFSAGFCTRLAEDESAGAAEVVFHGQEAWQFTYESAAPGGTMVKAIYFGQEDGKLLGFDSNLVQPDGTSMIINEVVYQVFAFNADPLEERFAEIWVRIPHGDDFVPVDEGTP